MSTAGCVGAGDYIAFCAYGRFDGAFGRKAKSTRSALRQRFEKDEIFTGSILTCAANHGIITQLPKLPHECRSPTSMVCMVWWDAEDIRATLNLLVESVDPVDLLFADHRILQ